MATTSDKIRKLYAAGISDQAELARRTGASRQLVHAALQRGGGPIGRPARDLVKLSIAVPEATEQWLREQSELEECSLGDVVHAVVERARRKKSTR